MGAWPVATAAIICDPPSTQKALRRQAHEIPDFLGARVPAEPCVLSFVRTFSELQRRVRARFESTDSACAEFSNFSQVCHLRSPYSRTPVTSLIPTCSPGLLRDRLCCPGVITLALRPWRPLPSENT